MSGIVVIKTDVKIKKKQSQNQSESAEQKNYHTKRASTTYIWPNTLILLMVKNLPEMKLDTEIKHQSQSVLVNQIKDQMFQFLIKNKPIITNHPVDKAQWL